MYVPFKFICVDRGETIEKQLPYISGQNNCFRFPEVNVAEISRTILLPHSKFWFVGIMSQIHVVYVKLYASFFSAHHHSPIS